jgi:RNA-directed DNA polymerase
MTGKAPPPKIQQIQRLLSVKASEEREYRFTNLYSLLRHPLWIETAYYKIRSNAGSRTAGVDGITRANWEAALDSNLHELVQEIKHGRFEPLPVKRRYILKASGKRRPLGIPALKDRIIQEAMRMALDPIFEADFYPSSYGFRIGRSTHNAIQHVYRAMIGSGGRTFNYCIEGDIASYFDTVDQTILLRLIARRVNDKKMMSLIKKFLHAGVMVGSQWEPTDTGVPQGGIASPLFSNLYLHELDRYLHQHYLSLSQREKSKRRRNGLSNFIYARFADDFVLLCNGTHQQVLEMKVELKEFLSDHLRIELSEEKTLVTDTREGFDFLGYRIYRAIRPGGTIVRTDVPRKAIVKVKEKIAKTTSPKTCYLPETEVVRRLSQILRGWGYYYRYAGNAGSVFNRVQRCAFWELAHWLGRKHKTRHMSSILKPPQLGGRCVRHQGIKTLCGIDQGKVETLFMLSSIKRRRREWKINKPNPYLQ